MMPRAERATERTRRGASRNCIVDRPVIRDEEGMYGGGTHPSRANRTTASRSRREGRETRAGRDATVSPLPEEVIPSPGGCAIDRDQDKPGATRLPPQPTRGRS